MVENLFILIASEVPNSLATIVKAISGVDQYTCVTTTKITDTLQLAKSLKPHLIVVHFREPKQILQELCLVEEIENTPIYSLTHRFQSSTIFSCNQLTLFTQSYDDGMQRNNLINNVRILLKLVGKFKIREEKTEPQGWTSIKSSYSRYKKNLARYTLELDQKRAVLENVQKKIKELCIKTDIATKNKLVSILNDIKISSSINSHWEDFKVYFEEINPRFVQHLSTSFPKLTLKDIKYCCYLKMNMSNEDIRNLLGINQESVRMHKYRLKRKLTLSQDQDLHQFLHSFSE
jgi:DNA-binding CsgD family transcriptional regulator